MCLNKDHFRTAGGALGAANHAAGARKLTCDPQTRPVVAWPSVSAASDDRHLRLGRSTGGRSLELLDAATPGKKLAPRSPVKETRHTPDPLKIPHTPTENNVLNLLNTAVLCPTIQTACYTARRHHDGKVHDAGIDREILHRVRNGAIARRRRGNKPTLAATRIYHHSILQCVFH